MIQQELTQIILKVFRSEKFLSELIQQTNFFFNLKLEYFFRDKLVIGLNEALLNDYIALAEYPRYKGSRVDVSICKRVNERFEVEDMIEMKYQFPRDLRPYEEMDKGYKSVILSDLKPKILNLPFGPKYFILIVADWRDNIDERKAFENQFRTPINDLNKYQLIPEKMDDNWQENVDNLFRGLELSLTKHIIEVKTRKIGTVNYHLFIGERKISV